MVFVEKILAPATVTETDKAHTLSSGSILINQLDKYLTISKYSFFT